MADARTVLVAGAGGLAGRSVVEALLAGGTGFRVRAGLRRREDELGVPAGDRLEIVEGDLLATADCRRLVEGCDAVIMCAARTGGAAMLASEPWLQVNDNLVMNARLLEACAF